MLFFAPLQTRQRPKTGALLSALLTYVAVAGLIAAYLMEHGGQEPFPTALASVQLVDNP